MTYYNGKHFDSRGELLDAAQLEDIIIQYNLKETNVRKAAHPEGIIFTNSHIGAVIKKVNTADSHMYGITIFDKDPGYGMKVQDPYFMEKVFDKSNLISGDGLVEELQKEKQKIKSRLDNPEYH